MKLVLEVEINGYPLVGKRLSFLVRVRQRLCLACGSRSTSVWLPRDDSHVTTHFHRCVSIFCDPVILTSADVTVGQGWGGVGRDVAFEVWSDVFVFLVGFLFVLNSGLLLPPVLSTYRLGRR